MEKKSSHLESKMTNLMSNISKTNIGDLGEKVSQLETIMSELKDKVSSQPNLKVKANDNKTIEYNYHDNASSSVQKSKQDSSLEPEKSHSSINIQHSNIPNSASEEQVSNIINTTKVIEVDQVSNSLKLVCPKVKIIQKIIQQEHLKWTRYLKPVCPKVKKAYL